MITDPDDPKYRDADNLSAQLGAAIEHLIWCCVENKRDRESIRRRCVARSDLKTVLMRLMGVERGV